MRHPILTLALSALLFAPGCGSDEPGADEAPDINTLGGKSDLADLATPVGYGVSVSGEVAEGGIVLFRLEGEPGDSQIELEIRKTGGGFDPRVDAYTAGGGDLRHDSGSFERDGDTSRKTVTLPRDLNGDPLLAVSAHGGSGAGTFELTVRCLGGECTGGHGLGGDPVHASICIDNARDCLFSQPVAPGAGGDVLSTCLQSATGVEGSCAEACEHDESAAGVCDLMAETAETLTAEADDLGDCHGVINSCLDSCMMGEENSPFLEGDDIDFEHTGAGMCWLDPNFLSDCSEFARENVRCGGWDTYDETSSFNSCVTWCTATEGPWSDDSEDACITRCGEEICAPMMEACDAECEGDDDETGCHAYCVQESEVNDEYRGEDCYSVW